ncbi:MAG: DUF4105 domain-containing protein [Treponema berlinense]|uniref:Lnb N-terminal periplasmic domain-containing protein n=1 Tax=Treponema berlinense TaxID=225004 RepID=UPI002A8333BD|nr:DUF4105 domain-containing protein [Treponema berlinense]MDY3707722.1 DUF4105 domain-containing protein [Treponema berlinense]
MIFSISKVRYGFRTVPYLFIVVFSLFFIFPAFSEVKIENGIGESFFKNFGQRTGIEGSFSVENLIGQKKSIDVEEVIQKAQDLKLWEDPYWRTLVHYKPTFFGHYKSLVDDPEFFCAKNGKTNPRAELIATVRAFFEEKIEIPEETKEEINSESQKESDGSEKNTKIKKHAIERFPGRYRWICEKLGLKNSDFPYDGDAAYQALLTKLNPGDIYLVFPAGYLKRPASVFGHTFLLVETKGRPRLTANSINYGAVTTLTGGPLYALLGLVGGFKGYYGFEAYYEKIKQYSDMDMRDMWEYRLNLTDDEKDRMLRHVFDLAGIYSRYYFTGENCSYNLLFLIEAARPSTKVTELIGGVVEPVETVKLVYESGLTDKVEYRPSIYSKIENEKTLLTKKEQKFAKKLCLGKTTVEDFPFENISPEKQAALWELCANYLNVLLHSNKISSDEYRPRYLSVLSARRKLGKLNPPEFSVPAHPEEAHGSKKIAFAGGYDKKGGFMGTNFRLTAHEQLERSAGYSENSELAFAMVDLRYNFSKNEFYLQKADLLSIISLPTSDLFFFNGASQLLTGLEKNLDKDGSENFAWCLKTLYGFSIRPVSKLQLYALAGIDCYFSPSYSYGTELFAGGETGLIAGIDIFRTKIYADFMLNVFDTEYLRSKFGIESGLSVSKNAALKGGYSFLRNYKKNWHEWNISFNLFY